jgi:hypothetical protein
LNQLRLFILKRKFLKISVDLQTALAAEAGPPEGQRLEEQLKSVKLHSFLAKTVIPNVSEEKWQ